MELTPDPEVDGSELPSRGLSFFGGGG